MQSAFDIILESKITEVTEFETEIFARLVYGSFNQHSIMTCLKSHVVGDEVMEIICFGIWMGNDVKTMKVEMHLLR